MGVNQHSKYWKGNERQRTLIILSFRELIVFIIIFIFFHHHLFPLYTILPPPTTFPSGNGNHHTLFSVSMRDFFFINSFTFFTRSPKPPSL